MAARMNSSSSSRSTDSITTSPPSSTSLKTWTTDSRDSCRWYGGISCERPRTCFDCLNVQLPGTECAVDAAGACVPITKYEDSLHTQGNYTYYPSANFSYCASSDVTCTACRSAWAASAFNTSSVSSIPGSSCVGDGGCVCIAYCEMPRWNESVLERNTCRPQSPSLTPDDSVIKAIDRQAGIYKLLLAFGIGLGLCTVFTLIALGVRHIVRVLEARAEETRRNRRRRSLRVLKGPLLNLMGWKGMMEKLIESEREHLAGDDGGPRHVLSTEAPAIVVEEGEGYRPASPSEHDQQRV